ncbi:hypothetical protein C479_03977 [Halovivax asiaticus JCM 14624]|uniref:Uncharacterized protein n=1 Tax=Halovivax asiaticus JCM 14624 TaxID=1227490 RepID=M0BR04_9EURY|nr:hypothetical protein C479_03977 [Halovivax asiaticus JCM 14624]
MTLYECNGSVGFSGGIFVRYRFVEWDSRLLIEEDDLLIAVVRSEPASTSSSTAFRSASRCPSMIDVAFYTPRFSSTIPIESVILGTIGLISPWCRTRDTGTV